MITKPLPRLLGRVLSDFADFYELLALVPGLPLKHNREWWDIYYSLQWRLGYTNQRPPGYTVDIARRLKAAAYIYELNIQIARKSGHQTDQTQ
jgi:hypothetical protein